MIKIYFIIIIFLLFSNCSFNTNSKFWNEDSNNNKKIVQTNDYKVETLEIEDKSYKKIKDEIIEYGKNKDFPDINN